MERGINSEVSEVAVLSDVVVTAGDATSSVFTNDRSRYLKE
jgi:hypothetical protein